MGTVYTQEDLINAVKNGDIKTIEDAFDTNQLTVDNKYHDPRFNNDIHFICLAVESGNLEMVKLFVEHGAKLDSDPDSYRFRPPLGVAVHWGFDDIVDYLLSAGASAEGACRIDETYLAKAAMDGNFHIMEALLANGASIRKALKYLENFEAMERLLDYAMGVDLSSHKDKESERFSFLGETALFGLNFIDVPGITPEFLESIGYKNDKRGIKSAYFAREDLNGMKDTKRRDTLLGRLDTYKLKPLWLAARQGYEQTVEARIATAEDPNVTQRGFHKPIVEAAAHHRLTIVRMLAQHPCIDKNSFIETIKYLAQSDNTGEIVDSLLKQLNEAQRNAALIALMGSLNPHTGMRVYVKTIHYLLQNGADPVFQDARGNTALHHLARADFNGTPADWIEDLVKALVRRGADINAKNNKGLTPLQIMAAEHDLRDPESRDRISAVMVIFIQYGADASFLARENKTLQARQFFCRDRWFSRGEKDLRGLANENAPSLIFMSK